MTKNYATCTVLLLFLFVSVVSTVFPYVEAKSPPILPSTVNPGLIPESSMPPYLMKFGAPPTQSQNYNDSVNWALIMDKFGAQIAGSSNVLNKYSSIVAGYGVGADGYYWIWIFPSSVPSFTNSTAESLVAAVENQAAELGYGVKIPVKIAVGGGSPSFSSSLDHSKTSYQSRHYNQSSVILPLNSQTGYWRPIIGGIQFYYEPNVAWFTTGFAAILSRGVYGFVIAGYTNFPYDED